MGLPINGQTMWGAQLNNELRKMQNAILNIQSDISMLDTSNIKYESNITSGVINKSCKLYNISDENNPRQLNNKDLIPTKIRFEGKVFFRYDINQQPRFFNFDSSHGYLEIEMPNDERIDFSNLFITFNEVTNEVALECSDSDVLYSDYRVRVACLHNNQILLFTDTSDKTSTEKNRYASAIGVQYHDYNNAIDYTIVGNGINYGSASNNIDTFSATGEDINLELGGSQYYEVRIIYAIPHFCTLSIRTTLNDLSYLPTVADVYTAKADGFEENSLILQAAELMRYICNEDGVYGIWVTGEQYPQFMVLNNPIAVHTEALALITTKNQNNYTSCLYLDDIGQNCDLHINTNNEDQVDIITDNGGTINGTLSMGTNSNVNVPINFHSADGYYQAHSNGESFWIHYFLNGNTMPEGSLTLYNKGKNLTIDNIGAEIINAATSITSPSITGTTTITTPTIYIGDTINQGGTIASDGNSINISSNNLELTSTSTEPIKFITPGNSNEPLEYCDGKFSYNGGSLKLLPIHNYIDFDDGTGLHIVTDGAPFDINFTYSSEHPTVYCQCVIDTYINKVDFNFIQNAYFDDPVKNDISYRFVDTPSQSITTKKTSSQLYCYVEFKLHVKNMQPEEGTEQIITVGLTDCFNIVHTFVLRCKYNRVTPTDGTGGPGGAGGTITETTGGD